jgi:hypothetical protein
MLAQDSSVPNEVDEAAYWRSLTVGSKRKDYWFMTQHLVC